MKAGGWQSCKKSTNIQTSNRVVKSPQTSKPQNRVVKSLQTSNPQNRVVKSLQTPKPQKTKKLKPVKKKNENLSRKKTLLRTGKENLYKIKR